MKRFRWYWPVLGLVVLLLAASIVYTLTSREPLSPRAGERAEIEQRVGGATEAGPSPARSWVAGNCVVEPRGQEREVAAESEGRIDAIPVEEGDVVEAGDVLVQLEEAPQRAAVAASKADVEQAAAKLSLLEAGTRAAELDQARAELGAARAQARLSQGVFRRLRDAYGGGGVTRDELDRARQQARADAQKAAAARAQLRLLEEGPRAQEIAEAEAALRTSQARLEEAETQLEARRITAPIDAEVLAVEQQTGEFYQPGEPLVILGDTTALRARMEVDERDIGAVDDGDAARVSVPDRTYEALVIEVGERVHPKAILTENPGDPTDIRVLEVLLAIEGREGLVVGQRGVCYVEAGGGAPSQEPEIPPRVGTASGAAPSATGGR